MPRKQCLLSGAHFDRISRIILRKTCNLKILQEMWFMNSSTPKSQQSSVFDESLNAPKEEDIQDEQNVPNVSTNVGPLNFLETMICCSSELKTEFISTGCKQIDKFLRGGIPCFGITEIFGESASAKTQLCLQLALFSQLPADVGGLKPSVVYISTEGSFPAKRMAQLAEYFTAQLSDQNTGNAMDNIIVETVPDSASLFRCLHVRIPALINEARSSRIRLIVIDSIAAIYRTEYNIDESVERAEDLRHIGAKLYQVGRSLGAAIVVVNQVTSSLTSGRNVPSLGLAWTNMVTTRLKMFRRPPDRFLEIVYAPHIPPDCMKISLTSKGISGVAENTPDQKRQKVT